MGSTLLSVCEKSLDGPEAEVLTVPPLDAHSFHRSAFILRNSYRRPETNSVPAINTSLL